MLPYIAEFLGTMLLIILGDGVVANVTLNKSGMKGAGSIQITLAWGLAVMVPAFIFGAASGAHFNPALTIALAIDGSLAWGLVPGYIAAQFAGAIVGAVIVYLMFKDQFDATEDPGTSWASSPPAPPSPTCPATSSARPLPPSCWSSPSRAFPPPLPLVSATCWSSASSSPSVCPWAA